MTENLPGLWRATLEMALDNGAVNRHRSQEDLRRDLADYVAFHRSYDDLAPIDAWLASITDDELSEVCCGGEGEPEQVRLLAEAPGGTDELLTEVFENVL